MTTSTLARLATAGLMLLGIACGGSEDGVNPDSDFIETNASLDGLGNTVAVSTGHLHTLALRADGTVWAWGLNNYGQLGDGTTVDRGIPTKVEIAPSKGALPLPLTGIVDIAGGSAHSLALQANGTVWAWGANYYGQLGDGTTITHRTRAFRVPGLTNVSAIAAGDGHSLALRADGTVWAWGDNYYGQLGGSDNNSYIPPRAVGTLTGIASIAVGSSHSLAVGSNGTVYAWGYNYDGQLGDGTTTNRSTPVALPRTTIGNIVAVTAGFDHTLALRADGRVFAWGRNNDGQLGNGTTNNSLIPVLLVAPVNVEAVEAGGINSMAVRSDGTQWAWGNNLWGQIGNGKTGSAEKSPVQAVGVTGMVAASVGDGGHSIGLRGDGTVWSWGTNYYGQLGDGTTVNRSLPAQINF